MINDAVKFRFVSYVKIAVFGLNQGRIEGGGRFPQGFDPLKTQRASPLYYFEIFIFGDGPNIFQRRLWRQYMIVLRERADAEKTRFSEQNFPKNAFFCGAENLGKNGLFSAL